MNISIFLIILKVGDMAFPNQRLTITFPHRFNFCFSPYF